MEEQNNDSQIGPDAPFLQKLIEALANDKLEVKEEAWSDFIMRRPQDVNDQRMSGGSLINTLYGITENGSFSEIAIQKGKKIIYPARNWHPFSDYPDDSITSGETLVEGIVKFGAKICNYFALYRKGYQEDGCVPSSTPTIYYNDLYVTRNQL